MMTHEDVVKAMAAILGAVESTIREMGPLGAPAGPMYAAMMTQGCSLKQFNDIVDALVTAGRVRRDGDVLHYVAREVA